MRWIRIIAAIVVIMATKPAFALQLAGVFSDHMVLQRDHTIPVWGKATPGSTISVNLDGKEQKVTVSSDGNWQADFPARAASMQAITLTVTGDGQTVTVNDILIGDIWFCSGQSNLGVTVNGAKGAVEELKKADHPHLRLLTVPSGSSWKTGDRPSFWAKDQKEPQWAVCTSTTAGSFTAVGYVFGSELLKKTGIPIGVINAAFGGAYIEPFIPRDLIKNSGKFPWAQQVLKRVDTITDKQMAELEIKNQQWNDDRKLASQSKKGIDAGWYKPGFNDAEWKTLPMPGFWQETAKLKVDGTVWFRRTINLTEEQAKSDRFSFGYLRMQARVWINGTELQVAPEAAGLSSITYAVPAGIIKAGSNTIAFRIYSMYGVGGLKRINKSDFSLQSSARKGEVVADLAGDWRYEVDMGFPQSGMPLQQGRTDFKVPGVIFNAMIAPYTKFPVRGIVWYQGESNVSRANEYTELLTLMINTWRSEWKEPALPFLIVQLPNYQPRIPEPSESDWANLRAAQDKVLGLPNTAMAVTYDVGEESELHPRDKRPVGERLAWLAEEMVYGMMKPAQSRSPRAVKAENAGNTIKVYFDPAVKLATKSNETPRGIAIAGADGKFTWARATIKGNVLIISKDAAPSANRIRYAWADNPDANLISKAGLLVAPFDITVN